MKMCDCQLGKKSWNSVILRNSAFLTGMGFPLYEDRTLSMMIQLGSVRLEYNIVDPRKNYWRMKLELQMNEQRSLWEAVSRSFDLRKSASIAFLRVEEFLPSESFETIAHLRAKQWRNRFPF